MSCNMAHRATFKGASRCGNMLQVYESDSKTCNIVARILHVALKIVSCNIPLPTVGATKLRQKLSRVTVGATKLRQKLSRVT